MQHMQVAYFRAQILTMQRVKFKISLVVLN